ncbi:hypothetical protein PDE_02065 [Penicillium oxalicum 114-2]|uniref:Uncharacterized protein n=1 Tax=Penicillium oxalicum (strain 114-2 / CGMCC 5302) TaxID=933388 RepID=S8AMK5_PENO1|nr:hypothetical protein PDE_02065 [Penicillium oxalicum 114-2]
MTRSSDEPPHYLFVQGPSLDRDARSALIRRRISQKRNLYREEEETKRQELIAQRQSQDPTSRSPVCICPGSSNDADGQTLGQPQRKRSATVHAQSRKESALATCEICGRTRLWSDLSSENAAVVVPGPLSGRLDPVLAAHSSLGPDANGLFQHSILHVFPSFRDTDYTARCYQSWVRGHPNNRLILYSILWSASCHRDTLRLSYGSNSTLNTCDQLYYKGRLLSLVREHVADFGREEWRDGIIMAILFMAMNETERRDLGRDANPFEPPFIHMQSLSFYGSRDFHQLHWNVVCDILTQLGGIHRIKLFALGWLASLADLMNAAHTLSKPNFPMVDVQGHVSYFAPSLRAFPIPFHMPQKNGFKELLSAHPPVKEGIVDVFRRLSLYSTLLQWTCTHQPDSADFDRLADFRYVVHHTLLSLPDERDPIDAILHLADSPADKCIASHELYLTCRLASHLYALHVTYPLPRSSLTRSLILPRLADKLDEIVQTRSSPLLLWCAAVAGIAAEGTTEEKRLTNHVRLLCHRLGVRSFESFEDILQSFAWVDVACMPGCRRLWKRLAITGKN